MRYPNAYRGVKKIFIGLLILTGMSILSIWIASKIDVYVYDSSYHRILSKIFDYSSFFVKCLCYVLLLLGVLQAGRDEPAFRPARLPLCLLLGIFFTRECLTFASSYVFYLTYVFPYSIVSNAFTWIYTISGIMFFLCSIWAGLSIVNGCIALADKLKARGLGRFGGVLRWLLPIACVRSLISSFSLIITKYLNNSSFVQSHFKSADYSRFFRWWGLLNGCALWLELLINILLLICLGRTLRLLRNQAPEIEPETEIAP